MKFLTVNKLASLAIIALACANSAKADVIAEWTFESSIPTTAGPHFAEGGLQVNVATARGFRTVEGAVYSNPVGNGSTESFSSNGWTTVGDYYEFEFSLAGYQDATFQWDQTRSGTGPGSFNLGVSTDGVNFTSLSDYTVDAFSWSSINYNPLSTFPAVGLGALTDDQSTVYVRLSSTVAVAAGGTNRIDNIIVRATAIPEPGTAGLLAVAFATMLVRRRR